MAAPLEWRSCENEYPMNCEIAIVAGGVAMYRDGEWYTGMDDPRWQRVIQWRVTHWIPLDDTLRGEK